MIHGRPDYARFQDPAIEDPSLLAEGSSPIAVDEPVFLFRAKDKYFCAILSVYLRLINTDMTQNHDDAMVLIDSIREQQMRANKWQLANPCQTPDMPAPPTEKGPTPSETP